MNLKERFNVLFFKNEMIKVIITDVNKRVNTHFIRIKDQTDFNIGERSYLIDYDKVFNTNGMPTYFYYIAKPNSISKESLSKGVKPLDVEASSKYDVLDLDQVSSKNLHTAIEETISSKIIRYAEDGDKKIINTILLMGIFNIFATLGGSYFIYITIEKVLNFVAENDILMKSIIDALASGVGN